MQIFEIKSHEKYLYVNFSVPDFMNIQPTTFALHSNMPFYGSNTSLLFQLQHWSLAVTKTVLKFCLDFFF